MANLKFSEFLFDPGEVPPATALLNLSELGLVRGETKLLSRKLTYSQSKPVNPKVADRWVELSAANQRPLITWIFDGTNWISENVFFRAFSFVNLGTAAPRSDRVPLRLLTIDHAIIVNSLVFSYECLVAQTDSVFWQLTYTQNSSNPGTPPAYFGLDTKNTPPNTAGTKVLTPERIILDGSALRNLTCSITAAGAAGVISGDANLSYSLVRK